MVQNTTVTNSITHQYEIESKINAERTKPCFDTNTCQNHNKKTNTKFSENEAMFGVTFLQKHESTTCSQHSVLQSRSDVMFLITKACH
jgi:hypothetical protein